MTFKHYNENTKNDNNNTNSLNEDRVKSIVTSAICPLDSYAHTASYISNLFTLTNFLVYIKLDVYLLFPKVPNFSHLKVLFSSILNSVYQLVRSTRMKFHIKLNLKLD